MKKRIIPLILTALCVLTLITGAVLARQQQTLSEKLVRLHVVANSDSDDDQAVKLRVRDAVLDMTQTILQDTDDPIAALGTHLAEIEQAAGEALRETGCALPVTVTLQNELFPRRDYDTFSLPAGVYRTLRVTIGAGEGHNWWCVVFPALCLPANAEDFEAACEAAGFTEGEISVLTEETSEIEVEFKTLELLGKLKKILWDA